MPQMAMPARDTDDDGDQLMRVNAMQDNEPALLEANYPKRKHEWAPLVARVSAHMTTGAAPSDTGSPQLAREWTDLLCGDLAGVDRLVPEATAVTR